jgi:anti-sigma regulatory factor (Ser/Thr protein kinase)
MEPLVPTAQSVRVRHALSPDGRHTLEMRIDSRADHVPEVRRAVEQFAGRAGFAECAVADVGLAVNEAIANVLRHAYGGASGKPVVITAEYPAESSSAANTPAALRVTIRDWGSGVNPAKLPPKARDPLQPGGVGLICMRRLMDDVAFTPQPDGMLLTMSKRKVAVPAGAERGAVS